jgi:glucose/arabinose dehydrogenase
MRPAPNREGGNHGSAARPRVTFCLPLAPVRAGAIELVPVASGLASPVFVGHAGDGSNRLFILEQAGVVKVLQPGASTPTDFLDIRAQVLSGGERGLLGLAFHPQYASNRRFFVYYTRVGDGALVIAEYHASTNPNVAEPTEIPILTIPHPTNANHNGGMLAFGSDRYLYVGVGDGARPTIRRTTPRT